MSRISKNIDTGRGTLFKGSCVHSRVSFIVPLVRTLVVIFLTKAMFTDFEGRIKPQRPRAKQLRLINFLCLWKSSWKEEEKNKKKGGVNQTRGTKKGDERGSKCKTKHKQVSID